jgi:hypothetical protein
MSIMDWFLVYVYIYIYVGMDDDDDDDVILNRLNTFGKYITVW